MASYTKLIFLICLSSTIFGCAHTDPKFITRVETVTVYKPVYTPPSELQQLEDIPRPDLATNHLTLEDKQQPGKVVKITIEAMAQLRAYAEMLETRIDVYKKALSRPADPLPENEKKVDIIEHDKPFEEQ